MVIYCAAYGCGAKKIAGDKDLNFHRFPFHRPDIVEEWLIAIQRRNWTPSPHSRLCSRHFIEKDYQIRPGAALKRLREEAIPSIFNFPVKERSLPVEQSPACNNFQQEADEMPGCRCSVAACKNSLQKTNGIVYHRFPKTESLQKQWMDLCGRSGEWNPETSRICSIHFTAEDYVRDLKSELLGLIPKRRILKETALPSLHLTAPTSLPDIFSSTRRRSGRKKRPVIRGDFEDIDTVITKADKIARTRKQIYPSSWRFQNQKKQTKANKRESDDKCEFITVEIEEFVCADQEMISYEVQVEANLPTEGNSVHNRELPKVNHDVKNTETRTGCNKNDVKQARKEEEEEEDNTENVQLHAIQKNDNYGAQLSPKQMHDQIFKYNVPPGWAIYYEIGKLVSVKLENEIVVISVTLDNNLNFHAKVHGENLKSSHPLQTVLSINKVCSVLDIFETLKMFDEWTTCKGTTEKLSIDKFLRYPTVTDCKLMYQTMSLHSDTCQQLLSASDESAICVYCTRVKELLNSVDES